MIVVLKIIMEEQVDEMDMKDVIALVNTSRGKGKKKSQNRMKFLMNELGNPQKELPVIHVVGTNGKGSTSSFIQSILKEAGYNVGLYTSPHLEKINERIRINDTFITDEELIELTEKVYPAVVKTETETKENLHAFEILTAVAFLYYAGKQVDAVILEAGIGGRLDATNVIEDSLVSVITSIGLDHVNVLGDTIEKIAVEKVAIVKPEGNLVTFDAPTSLKEIFIKKAKEQNAVYTPVDATALSVNEIELDYQRFDYKQYKDLKIRMLGEHQVRNAVLAIEAVEVLNQKGFHISPEQLKEGLAKNFWSGRFEKISDHPLAFLDGAHNSHAVEVLVSNIRTWFPGKKVTFILGMMEDKDYSKMIELVFPVAAKFLTLAPDSDRALESVDLTQMLRDRGYEASTLLSPRDALRYIHEEADSEELIVIFGSLYLVGNIKEEMHLFAPLK